MVTLSEAIERRFPLDDEWARLALGTMGGLSDEATVHDIAQGWLRVGGDAGVLVDTLFVLTEERLGFGQTQAETGQPSWIELARVVALDAIEGLPYPLVAVEVQLAGGIAMLVGWPDEFCQQVVDVLTRSVQRARDEAVTAATGPMPADFADPAATVEHADPSTIEDLSPSGWVEAPVLEPPAAAPPAAELPDAAAPAPAPDLDTASPWASSPWSSDRSTQPDPIDALGTPAWSTPVEPEPAAPEAVWPPEPVAPEPVAYDDRFVAETHAPFPEAQVPDTQFPDTQPEPAEDSTPAGFEPLFGSGDVAADHDERVEAFFGPDDVETYAVADPPPFHDEPSGFAGFGVGAPEPQELTPSWADPSAADGPAPAHSPVPEPGPAPEEASAARPRSALSSRSIVWPEPFRPSNFLGDHPEHSRRRKNVSLGFSPAGITAVSTGFHAWKLHLLWDDVRSLEFEGADEVKFTHNHRIDMNATAVIITLTDDTTMVFEVRSRRPAMMRSTMAPIVNALASHRAMLSGNEDGSGEGHGHGTTFTF
jgi:hypothetical protein